MFKRRDLFRSKLQFVLWRLKRNSNNNINSSLSRVCTLAHTRLTVFATVRTSIWQSQWKEENNHNEQHTRLQSVFSSDIVHFADSVTVSNFPFARCNWIPIHLWSINNSFIQKEDIHLCPRISQECKKAPEKCQKSQERFNLSQAEFKGISRFWTHQSN